MARYSMFLDRMNQYCENVYTTKCNLQVQCDPYQITNGIFHRTRKKTSQFIWKHKRPWIARAVLRKNGAEGISLPDFRLYYEATVISSHFCASMVLAQKQKYRSMEQDRKPRNKPMHTPISNLSLTKEARVYNEEKSLFNKWCWENWTATCKRLKLEHFLTP